MIKRFECRNFKGFKNTLVFDLTSRDFCFKKELVKNGLVNKALIYGKNGSGKSNLGIALFDIISHLTDKQRIPYSYIANYLCLNSIEEKAIFKYYFSFNGEEVVYEYAKTNYDNLIYEKVSSNDKVIIDYNYFDNHYQQQNLRFYL